MTDRLPEVMMSDGDPDMSRPFWNPAMETLPPDQARALQERKLVAQLRYLQENSTFYQQKFAAAGFDPRDFKSLGDIDALPLTTKRELRENQEEQPPFGKHLAAPKDKVVRITTTAGTTGRPVIQGYTRNDVMRRNESVSRVLWSFGVRPGDIVLNGFALSMFNAGIPFCTAVEHLGAIDVPVGAERRAEGLLKVARDVGADVLIATPSFISYLGERCPEILGIPASELGVRVICGGGEPGFELPAVRSDMQRVWGTEHIYDLASTSDAHPNSFANCRMRDGKHHITPDLVLVQLIDPNTGRRVEIEDQAVGEYIFTHLDREACPLLRYRTNDIVRITTQPCECGRPTFRMDIIGRSDDMLIVRGMNVFPSAIQSIVSDFMPRSSGKLQIVLDRPGPSVAPPLRVRVEAGRGVTEGASDELGRAIEKKIRANLSVTTAIEILPYGAFERTATKTRLVVVEDGGS